MLFCFGYPGLYLPPFVPSSQYCTYVSRIGRGVVIFAISGCLLVFNVFADSRFGILRRWSVFCCSFLFCLLNCKISPIFLSLVLFGRVSTYRAFLMLRELFLGVVVVALVQVFVDCSRGDFFGFMGSCGSWRWCFVYACL